MHDDARMGRQSEAEKAELLLAAARYLSETLEPARVYDRFHKLLEEAVPHAGVVVSSFDTETELISCDYAWVDGEKLDPAIFPSLALNRKGGGMQSRVITTGEPLLVNDVPEQVKEPGGVYYDVDREGHMRKVPEEGPPGVRAAMMLPIKHEGEVVGVVQLMNAEAEYDEWQLGLAEGLVGLMGAAARNARLHETAQAEAAARARAEATAAEREHAARVLDAVGDGVFLLDDEGYVRFWNHAAELVTGKAGDEVWGRPAGDLFGQWERLGEQIPVSRGSAAARPVTLPVDVEGRELWLSFVAVRSLAGVVYAFRDLTIERRLDEAKSEFVATVSHELRTPLTAVMGAAKTLMRDDVELSADRRRQLLEMIGAQGTRLAKIAEDLLIASRLDRDELRLDSDPVDLGEVVEASVEIMREYLPQSISLTASTGSNGASALGDRSRIEQVLVNLIDNAIKYSPGGGEVLVSTGVSDAGVRVEVRDHGIGIPPSEQASVFEKFYRGSLRGASVRAGTGLGLYICRELVRRMGGSIGVRSEPGAGSTFFFELPRA
jgi:two-component system phosphate regulon sensor histidine kinase PhoR